MPLDRAHMTVASQVMLPTYVVFFAWLGFNYLLTDKSRLVQSPVLAFADRVIHLEALGFLLVAAAALVLYALASHRRDVGRYALVLAGISFGLLFVIFGLATLLNDASPSAAAWPFLGFRACRASYLSLTVREVN